MPFNFEKDFVQPLARTLEDIDKEKDMSPGIELIEAWAESVEEERVSEINLNPLFEKEKKPMPDTLGAGFDRAFKEKLQEMKAKERAKISWDCDYCDVSNNSEREKCLNCNAPRSKLKPPNKRIGT